MDLKIKKAVSYGTNKLKSIANKRKGREGLLPQQNKQLLELEREFSQRDRTTKQAKDEYTRRLNAIQRPFLNNTGDTRFEDSHAEALHELRAEQAEEALQQADSAIGATISTTNALLGEAKAKQKKLWEQHQESIKEVTSLQQQLDTQKLHLKTFRKQWDAEKVTRFLQNPTNDEFLRERVEVVEAIGIGFEEWEKNRGKVADEKRKEDNRIKKQRADEIAYRRRFRDEAIKICSGRLPFPDELKNNHTAQSIDLMTLSWFLRNKYEKEQNKAS